MMNPFSGWLTKARSRGEAYTALDAMKFLAVVTMTVDHIGYYYCPDDMWWRAVGRIAIAVWFFLIGYSKSRSIDINLWIYGVLLTISEAFSAAPVFPLTVLINFIICRWVITVCEDRGLLPSKLPEIIVIASFLSLITVPLFEYGSVGFLFALLGRMVYQKQTQYLNALAISSYSLYVIWQCIVFPFTPLQVYSFITLGGLVVWWLTRCNNTVIWQTWSDSWWKTCVAVLSRNTLPYYFYHRIIMAIVFDWLVRKSFAFHVQFF